MAQIGPLTVFLLLLSAASTEQQQQRRPRCILQDDSSELSSPEAKYFYYGDRPPPLGIFSTRRTTHRIASTVLQIFAEEVIEAIVRSHSLFVMWKLYFFLVSMTVSVRAAGSFEKLDEATVRQQTFKSDLNQGCQVYGIR